MVNVRGTRRGADLAMRRAKILTFFLNNSINSVFIFIKAPIVTQPTASMSDSNMRLIHPQAPSESNDRYVARIRIAREAFDSLRLSNAAQQMLALQAIGAHTAVMASFQIAMRPDVDPATANRCRASATTMARMMRDTIAALKRDRHAGQPDKPAG